MQPLFRSLTGDSGVNGEPLPQVWSTFINAKLKWYPGEVIMWAGPPGSGKSTLALNYMIRSKVPTLYISSDMPRSLVVKRSCAIATETDQDVVEEELRASEGRAKYEKVLKGLNHIFVEYPARPDAESLAMAQMAFMEIHGIPSPLMVVDNLMNMNSGNDNEWAGLRELSQVLKFFAFELNICVLLLHHTALGEYTGYPAPERAIMGKVAELPATILTIAKGSLVAPVKNRHGPADDSGRTYVTLHFDGAKQIISDPRQEVLQPTPQRTPPVYAANRRQDWRERAYKDD